MPDPEKVEVFQSGGDSLLASAPGYFQGSVKIVVDTEDRYLA
jgi:hypothetical protein